jgi:hypothetical protein
MAKDRDRWTKRAAPALLLAFLAPMLTEILPGATRFSALFVFPIEMAVWGGGAVLIRALVRSRGLGWWSLALLGLALAVAEECLIQQTSLAPMILQLKGETWARAFGVNYVYLLWALVYETVWVVLVPVLLAEMVFPARRDEPWLSRSGAILTGLLFAIGCGLAWFTWTRMARVHVFHLPPYTPSLAAVAAALLAIALLGAAAMALGRAPRPRPLPAPPPWVLGPLAGLWAAFWYGLVLLAFGIAPRVPPAAAVAAALTVVAAVLLCLPRWASSDRWRRGHDYALILGALGGSMAVSFIGFLGSEPRDLGFKIIVDAAALGLLFLLGRRRLAPASG